MDGKDILKFLSDDKVVICACLFAGSSYVYYDKSRPFRTSLRFGMNIIGESTYNYIGHRLITYMIPSMNIPLVILWIMSGVYFL